MKSNNAATNPKRVAERRVKRRLPSWLLIVLILVAVPALLATVGVIFLAGAITYNCAVNHICL